MRVNKFRAVSVRSVAAQRDRALLTAREQLRRQSLDTHNVIWAILQVEGLKPPKLTNPSFQALVAQSSDDEAGAAVGAARRFRRSLQQPGCRAGQGDCRTG